MKKADEKKGEEMLDKDDLSALLDRNIGFINNCDTKTSVGLAINGVMMSFVLSIMTGCESGGRALYIAPLMLLIVGASCFVYTLWARYEKCCSKTLFWCYSSNIETQKEQLMEMNDDELKVDLCKQAIVNGILARKKYEWYNLGLFCTVSGSLGCILIVLGRMM